MHPAWNRFCVFAFSMFAAAVILQSCTADVAARRGTGAPARPPRSSMRPRAVVMEEPGGGIDDIELALTNPDEYAWKVFVFINQQAKTGVAGVPDSSRNGLTDYAPDTGVVWETWALSSGDGQQSEVFKADGSSPGDWTSLRRMPGNKRLYPGFTPQSVPPPISTDADNQESRMNRSTFQTVIDKCLYNATHLLRLQREAAAGGRGSIIRFEPSSKEVKARWIVLTACKGKGSSTQACDEIRNRYHWRTIGADTYGLAGLHIITRDLPNWFWADFGHIDCDFADSASVDVRNGCAGVTSNTGPAAHDSTTVATNGVRPETRGSKWENYRLRGTQLSFEDAAGAPTVLWNPTIENARTSCITCHFYASVPPPAVTNFTLLGKPDCAPLYERTQALPCPSPNGEPDEVFKNLQHVLTDFVWSVPMHAFANQKDVPDTCSVH